MNDKEIISKLEKLLWEYAGCAECIHQISITNECGTYPDCDINWCKSGEYFKCK